MDRVLVRLYDDPLTVNLLEAAADTCARSQLAFSVRVRFLLFSRRFFVVRFVLLKVRLCEVSWNPKNLFDTIA